MAAYGKIMEVNRDFIEISWPAKKNSVGIMPLFLPFAGCEARCVFCAQEAQTGVKRVSGEKEIKERLGQCRKTLEYMREQKKPLPQLAFYGGTFTALPDKLWNMCLDFAESATRSKLIRDFRCSTRPDKLSYERLRQLAESGCVLIEIGAQSFDDKALESAKRGYRGAICEDACAMISECGMGTCVHLMPGLPGVDERVFLEDINIALKNGVKFMRFSPCLVLAGTHLAAMWRGGEYLPWNMEQALDALAKGYIRATRGGAVVTRVGLAPEDQLELAILAGPRHPSLGSRVKGRALLNVVASMLASLKKEGESAEKYKLFVPQFCRGEIWGWRGELELAWQKMCISRQNVLFHDKDIIRIEKY